MASSTRISLIFFASLVVVHFLGSSYLIYQISLYLIYAIVVQSVGLVWSKTNILPLGQSLFFGLGAYLCAICLRTFDNPVLQLTLIIVSIIAVTLLAYVLAAVVFKGRSETGPFFALITLALVMIAEQVATSATEITGGFNGMTGFTPFLDLDPMGNFYWVVAIGCTLTCFTVLRINELPIGVIASAMVDNEQRLQLFGFPTYIIKAIIFGIGAAFSAFAGVLFANHQEIVTPTSIGFFLTAEFVIWCAVGGRLHPLGAILGTVLIGMLSSGLRDTIMIWDVLLASTFILVVLTSPKGLWGLIQDLVLTFYRPKNEKTSPILPAPPVHHSTTSAPIHLDNVVLKLNNIHILNGISMTSPQSGVLAIIGPNGAGKTSLLNVIIGNVPVTKGTINYTGKSIGNRDPFLALGDGIGRKLQVPSLFMTMSLKENIAIATFANRLRPTEYLRSSALSWQTEWYQEMARLPEFSFLDNQHQETNNLPQGHRQFLEFLMTTISEPRLLLLDEPCAGLSPHETHLMSTLVQQYTKNFNALTIVIEHDMHIVESISDQVIVMHQGDILALGKYSEIKKDPNVKAVYLGESKA